MNYSKPQTDTVTFLDVTEPSEEIKKQLFNKALLTLKTHEQSLQKLLNTDTIHSSRMSYPCSGQLSVGFANFSNHLTIQKMNFKGFRGSLTFQGSGHAIDTGGGVTWFTGIFNVTPSALTAASKVDYIIANQNLGTTVSFYINGTLVGVLVAMGLQIGINAFAGSGTFKGSVS